MQNHGLKMVKNGWIIPIGMTREMVLWFGGMKTVKSDRKGNYKGGMRFGEWTYYQEDGKILYTKTFRDGQAISTKYGEPSEDN